MSEPAHPNRYCAALLVWRLMFRPDWFADRILDPLWYGKKVVVDTTREEFFEHGYRKEDDE